MIVEAFFLAEEKHAYSEPFFQDLFRLFLISPISPTGPVQHHVGRGGSGGYPAPFSSRRTPIS
jgi:hypothetical protein